MWNLLSTKRQVSLIVAVTVMILFAVQAANDLWVGEQPSLLRLISLIGTIIGTVLFTIANWVWRPLWRMFPVLNRVAFPDLNGVWEGELRSTWIDPETGGPIPPIPTKITIRQGILKISVKQRTGESTSWSTRVLPESEPDADRYRLWYSYSNKPKMAYSHRSNDHDGIAWLEVALDENPDELVGQYYTSRKTSGDLNLQRVE